MTENDEEYKTASSLCTFRDIQTNPSESMNNKSSASLNITGGGDCDDGDAEDSSNSIEKSELDNAENECGEEKFADAEEFANEETFENEEHFSEKAASVASPANTDGAEVFLETATGDPEIDKQRAIELKAAGNAEFSNKYYEKAVTIYSEAVQICPSCQNDLKAVLYSNRAASYAKLECYDDAVEDCTKSIESDPTFLKAFIRRAHLYEYHKDAPEKALQDYESIIEKDPSNSMARCNIMRLQPIVAERNEKLKQEMIGKLKDLGNLFLRPFGLSTDNFKLEPNESGGYSVKMEK